MPHPEPMEEPEKTAERQSSAESERVFSWRERIQLALISWAAIILIRLIGPTLRVTFIPEPGCISDAYGSAPPSIWCFWHRCVIPASYQFRNHQIAVMTSRSFDGEYIARIIRHFGFVPVRGSSSRGAVGALMGMRRELEQAHGVAFTIDGPRGPRYVAKPGPVLLAKKTGAPLSCFYVHVERAWILNSWDKMMIPKPFSRAVLYVSAPVTVPPEADDEQMAGFHAQMQAALERCRLSAENALSE